MTLSRQATDCMCSMHRSIDKEELQMFELNRTPAQAATRGPACEQSSYFLVSRGLGELYSEAQIMAVSRCHLLPLLHDDGYPGCTWHFQSRVCMSIAAV